MLTLTMPQEEIGVGIEVVNLVTKEGGSSISSGIGSGSSAISMTMMSSSAGTSKSSSSSVMLLKTSPTWPISEDVSPSAVSSESRMSSFELEYSDEEFSVASNVDDNLDLDYGLHDDGNGNDNGNEKGNLHSYGRERKQGKQTQTQMKMHVMPDTDYNYPSLRTLDLVIDEIPTIQRRSSLPLAKSNNKDGSTTTNSITTNTNKSNDLVRSKSFSLPSRSNKNKKKPEKITACPCCGSYVHYHVTKKQNKLTLPTSESSPDERGAGTTTTANMLTSFVDSLSLWSTQSHSSGSGECEVISGENDSSVVKTLDYTIKNCIIEGWVNKKGTGNDIFRSTFWKPRWCRLVMADIPGKDQYVPLLLVSWHVSVNPSNIIILGSSVAISVDYDDASGETTDNVHCFDIVSTQDDMDADVDSDVDSDVNANATRKKLSNGKLTRTFSAPSVEQRDEWVLKINQAISNYDKSRRMAIRQNQERLLPPTSPIRRTPSGQLLTKGLNGLSIQC